MVSLGYSRDMATKRREAQHGETRTQLIRRELKEILTTFSPSLALAVLIWVETSSAVEVLFAASGWTELVLGVVWSSGGVTSTSAEGDFCMELAVKISEMRLFTAITTGSSTVPGNSWRHSWEYGPYPQACLLEHFGQPCWFRCYCGSVSYWAASDICWATAALLLALGGAAQSAQMQGWKAIDMQKCQACFSEPEYLKLYDKRQGTSERRTSTHPLALTSLSDAISVFSISRKTRREG